MPHVLKIVRVAFAEMGGQYAVAGFAELKPARIDASRRKAERSFAEGPRPFFWLVVDERASFNQRLRARKIGCEFAACERPSGMREPVAFFEIDVVEGPAPSAPVIRAAAQIAKTGALEGEIRHSF